MDFPPGPGAMKYPGPALAFDGPGFSSNSTEVKNESKQATWLLNRQPRSYAIHVISESLLKDSEL